LKFAISYRVIKLALAVQAKKLAVALGNFIKAKFITDTVSVEDTAVITRLKFFTDLVGATDDPIIVPNKGINNTVTFQDDSRYFAEDYISEDYVLQTGIEVNFGKALAESVGVQSSTLIETTYRRSFADGFVVTDDIDGAVTPEDDQEIQFFKNTTNIVGITDSTALQLGIGLSEAPAATDSGLIVSQGYCDITYFAEDYVGESRTI
jgi:hypothetical protein